MSQPSPVLVREDADDLDVLAVMAFWIAKTFAVSPDRVAACIQLAISAKGLLHE